MKSLWKVYHANVVHLSALLLILLFSLASLVSCNQPAPPQYMSINLGIPAAALQSPVKGPLPDSTLLYVGITFKIDPRLLDQANRQKLQPGQSSSEEQFAKRLGISESTFQKIQSFFSPQGIRQEPLPGCCKQSSLFTSIKDVRSTHPQPHPKYLPFLPTPSMP